MRLIGTTICRRDGSAFRGVSRNSRGQRRIAALLLAGAVSLSALASPSRAAPAPINPLIDQPHYSDPAIVEPAPELEFHPRLAEVWGWALDQPSADTRRRAASAIADAYRRGDQSLRSFAGRLTILLDKQGQHPLVRLAAAEALITLDVRDAEVSLIAHNRADGMDMILLTDPALARWQAANIRQTWINRAIDPSLDRSIRQSAIQSLGAVRETQAYASLLKIVQDEKAEMTLRTAASSAAAACRPETETSLAVAQRFLEGSPARRLLAARLLASEKGDGAIAALLRLAVDADQAVAAKSLQRLLEIAPERVDELADTLLKSSDPNIRLLAVQGIVAQHRPERIKLVADALDDVALSVRQYARDQMILMDHDSALRPQVRAEAKRILKSDNWRGLEQAALIVGKLDDQAASSRLLELIKHQRPEVRLAAAAALRWIDDPETLAPILTYAREITEKTSELTQIEGEKMTAYASQIKHANSLIDQGRTDEMPPRIEPRLLVRSAADTDRELVQYFCFFAKRRYAAAEPLLRSYVPKHSQPYGEGRGAAIYALGYLYENKSDASLAAALSARAVDNNPLDPEVAAVRRFSLITLGRMKASQGLGALNSIYRSAIESYHLRAAARWGIIHSTGKEVPPITSQKQMVTGWWLEPLD
ncbi:MAG: HEAT repeat domain-containing protein [Phycisphaeraceae bacterium]|nr:HEAT repeat domain-containing protein [Phycisphaeraceae bacterium]